MFAAVLGGIAAFFICIVVRLVLTVAAFAGVKICAAVRTFSVHPDPSFFLQI